VLGYAFIQRVQNALRHEPIHLPQLFFSGLDVINRPSQDRFSLGRWNELFLRLYVPLKNICGEIVVFQIVKTVLDHLSQVESFGTTRFGGQEVKALLGFGG
jgi:hypothetical protein